MFYLNMKNDILNQYLIERLQSIERHLYAYKIDKVPERLHQLRVEIKKIKAVNAFAEFLFDEKVDSDKIKKVFDDAGDIRELQINTRILSKFPRVPESVIISLRKKERSLKSVFVKNIPSYVKDVKKILKNISLPSKLPAIKKMKGYFIEELNKALEELDTRDKKGLHKYRMRIKRMMYIYGALPSKVKGAIPLDKGKVDDLQLKVGAWHDTYMAISFLSDQAFAGKISKPLMKLKAKENRQFLRVMKNLDGKTDDFNVEMSKR